MTSEPSVTAEVEVAVDPVSAFQVFTEEMGKWWIPGPINFWDSARAIEMRCESGVRGRLIEVYDETGEGLELGRFTVWEPGDLLVWQSSIDDVETTVRFSATSGGTRVVVEARIPEGGRDEGGSAWVRVAPTWFETWCGRRDRAVEGQPMLSRLGLTVYYDKPIAGARWISQILGTDPTLPLPGGEDAGEPWIEFRVGDGMLVVLPHEEDSRAPRSPTHMPWVFVDDLDAQHERISAAHLGFAEPIFHHGYRAFTIEDPEGHRWTIAQTFPSVVHPGESVLGEGG